MTRALEYCTAIYVGTYLCRYCRYVVVRFVSHHHLVAFLRAPTTWWFVLDHAAKFAVHCFSSAALNMLSFQE